MAQLREAIAESTTFCTQKGIDFAVLKSAQGFVRTKFWADAVESIIINDDAKKTYLSLAGNVNKLYKAILPDPRANEFTLINAHLQAIKDQILAEVPEVDVSEVMEQVEELLDLSITPGKFVILESQSQRIDLSQIDFEAFKNKFASTDYQRTETEKLKTAIASLSYLHKY